MTFHVGEAALNAANINQIISESPNQQHLRNYQHQGKKSFLGINPSAVSKLPSVLEIGGFFLTRARHFKIPSLKNPLQPSYDVVLKSHL
jgi:hypothetical protein